MQNRIHPNQRILVTGATGLLGSYLLRYLLHRGYTHIYALRQPESSMELLSPAVIGGVRWIEADILDLPALEEAIKEAQWVFHCAGIISFDPMGARQMRQVNVEGTTNVVDLCLIHGVEKLLHVSSVAALGRTQPGQTISESNKWERSPYNTRYGVSKFLGELEVWRGMEEGLNAVVINPAIILGSGRWEEGPARFFRMLHRGFPFYPRGGTDLVDVRDVVRAMVELMESDISHERFIVSGGHLSYKAFFERIAFHLGTEVPRRTLSGFLQEIAWRVAWFQRLFNANPGLLSKETVRQSAHEYYYDNQKLRDRLSFHYTPLEQTIGEIAQDYIGSVGREHSVRVLPFQALNG